MDEQVVSDQRSGEAVNSPGFGGFKRVGFHLFNSVDFDRIGAFPRCLARAHLEGGTHAST